MLVHAKTLKGFERIWKYGRDWDLLRTADEVVFAQRPGPWGLIRPFDDFKNEHTRWIHLLNDKDFEIVG